MKRKITKIIKLIIILICVISLLFSIIVSQDYHHLETCHDEYCAICTIIHISQKVINIIIAFIVTWFIKCFFKLVLSKLIFYNKNLFKTSLVLQNIQLNE